MAIHTRVLHRERRIPGKREYVIPNDISPFPLHELTITGVLPVGQKYLRLPERMPTEILRKYRASVTEALIPYQVRFVQRHWGSELTVRVEGESEEANKPVRALTDLLVRINLFTFSLYDFQEISFSDEAPTIEQLVYEPQGPWHLVASNTATQTIIENYWDCSMDYRGAYFNRALRRFPYVPGTTIEVTCEKRGSRDEGELLYREPRHPATGSIAPSADFLQIRAQAKS